MESVQTLKSEAASREAAQAAAADQIQPRRTDKHIWGIYIALVLISIVELYSASAHEVNASNVMAPVIRHFMFLLIGLGLMLSLQKVHYRYFLKWSYAFAIFSALAMLYTMFFGDLINGARRSFSVMGLFALQPAEMVKISAALVIAGILSRAQNRKGNDISNWGLRWTAGAVLIAGGLLFFQGLTNTLLLMAISLSMMIIGGISFKKLALVLIFYCMVGLVAIVFKVATSRSHSDNDNVLTETVIPGTNITMSAYSVETGGDGAGRVGTWEARIRRFLKGDKYNDPITNENQQEQYSYIAQAHGGVIGVWPGNSRETSRLPLAFSDYIYAIIVEELGLIGGIGVLILYLWLLVRAGRIANRCQTAYPALLVIGMAVFIAFQAIFHMAIVTGVFPVSGQPLPLISKGGTSILITSVALGIMLSVSRFAARKGKKSEIKEELNALSEELTAQNPT